MTLMTASEARYRAENQAIMNMFERQIEEYVTLAVKKAECYVTVAIPQGMDRDGVDIIKGNLENLGYTVKLPKGFAVDTILLEW